MALVVSGLILICMGLVFLMFMWQYIQEMRDTNIVIEAHDWPVAIVFFLIAVCCFMGAFNLIGQVTK